MSRLALGRAYPRSPCPSIALLAGPSHVVPAAHILEGDPSRICLFLNCLLLHYFLLIEYCLLSATSMPWPSDRTPSAPIVHTTLAGINVTSSSIERASLDRRHRRRRALTMCLGKISGSSAVVSPSPFTCSRPPLLYNKSNRELAPPIDTPKGACNTTLCSHAIRERAGAGGGSLEHLAGLFAQQAQCEPRLECRALHVTIKLVRHLPKATDDYTCAECISSLLCDTATGPWWSTMTCKMLLTKRTLTLTPINTTL